MPLGVVEQLVADVGLGRGSAVKYDYAVHKGKPVMSLLRSSEEGLSPEQIERDPETIQKIDAFRKKVSAGRMCKFYEHPAEVGQHVMAAYNRTKKTHPGRGWMPGTWLGPDLRVWSYVPGRGNTTVTWRVVDHHRGSIPRWSGDQAWPSEATKATSDGWFRVQAASTPRTRTGTTSSPSGHSSMGSWLTARALLDSSSRRQYSARAYRRRRSSSIAGELTMVWRRSEVGT